MRPENTPILNRLARERQNDPMKDPFCRTVLGAAVEVCRRYEPYIEAWDNRFSKGLLRGMLFEIFNARPLYPSKLSIVEEFPTVQQQAALDAVYKLAGSGYLNFYIVGDGIDEAWECIRPTKKGLQAYEQHIANSGDDFRDLNGPPRPQDSVSDL